MGVDTDKAKDYDKQNVKAIQIILNRLNHGKLKNKVYGIGT